MVSFGNTFQKSFQSTLPRRERLFKIVFIARTIENFNPRSREGSDKYAPFCNVFYFLFQSTLPRRERPYVAREVVDRRKFQSTLPRRERRDHRTYSNKKLHFNPRSREGSDSGLIKNASRLDIFQSTLPRRERR